MNAVHFRNLGKRYAGVPVLADVSFQIPAGAVTAIIGRSGSGKSTLLKTVNGLVVPDSGSVDVFGQPIDYAALPQFRRGIGYAVQGSGLFPHLTVADNISLLPRLEGWEEGRAKLRLQQLAEMVQLAPKLLDRFPHELSGGQQQRAGLCRAMVLNPRLLLLDEPFGALDPLTRLDIHARFRRLQSLEPRTLLLVTHDMREAMSLAQHVVVLEKGRLLLKAGTAELQARSPGLDAEQLLLELLEELA